MSAPRSRFLVLLPVFAASLLAAAPLATAAAPAPFSWGGDLRLRDEYYNGATTLDTSAALHEQQYLRLRARLWSAWTPVEGLEFRARLAAEPRSWITTAGVKQCAGETGPEERYALLDTLTVQWKTEAAGAPLTFTVGRQDILLGAAGQWWLVMDGTACEGSWTGFFDAARLTAELPALRTTFDLVVLDQGALPDDRLGTIGPGDSYALTEQDERGVILRATHTLAAGRQLEALFIYKHDDRVLANGTDADLCTTALRFAAEPPAARWHASIQGAWQWGDKADTAVKTPVPATGRRDVRAWAAEGRLTHLFRDAHDQRLALVAEFLSGDDPDTAARDEMFDLLWGRWPRTGDVVGFATIPESGGRYAQLQNTLRLGAEWNATLRPGSTLAAGYQALFAPEAVPTRATKPALFSGEGHFRGHLVRATVRHRFTEKLSALLQVEAMTQGDFYTRNDTLTFVRAEVMTTF